MILFLSEFICIFVQKFYQYHNFFHACFHHSFLKVLALWKGLRPAWLLGMPVAPLEGTQTTIKGRLILGRAKLPMSYEPIGNGRMVQFCRPNFWRLRRCRTHSLFFVFGYGGGGVNHLTENRVSFPIHGQILF